MALPSACLLEVTRKQTANLFMPTQFGVGSAAGAEALVLEAKLLASLRLGHTLAALDAHNAFGQVARAEVLREVIALAPAPVSYTHLTLPTNREV